MPIHRSTGHEQLLLLPLWQLAQIPRQGVKLTELTPCRVDRCAQSCADWKQWVGVEALGHRWPCSKAQLSYLVRRQLVRCASFHQSGSRARPTPLGGRWQPTTLVRLHWGREVGAERAGSNNPAAVPWQALQAPSSQSPLSNGCGLMSARCDEVLGQSSLACILSTHLALTEASG